MLAHVIYSRAHSRDPTPGLRVFALALPLEVSLSEEAMLTRPGSTDGGKDELLVEGCGVEISVVPPSHFLQKSP